MKRIRFWGTRGSLAGRADGRGSPDASSSRRCAARRDARSRTAMRIDDYVDGLDFAVAGTYGGHYVVRRDRDRRHRSTCSATSAAACVRSGRRRSRATARESPQTYHIFVSHVHWDHIMGLPFFTPAYIPGNRIHILRRVTRARVGAAAPAGAAVVSRWISRVVHANIEFVHLEPGKRYDIAGMSVTLEAAAARRRFLRLSLRVERPQSVVYSTDSEHKLADPRETAEFVEFFRAADVVIFDAMYSLADADLGEGRLGPFEQRRRRRAVPDGRVRHLCLFHHEPANDDEAIARVLADTRRLEEITRTGAPLRVTAAYDGMEIDVVTPAAGRTAARWRSGPDPRCRHRAARRPVPLMLDRPCPGQASAVAVARLRCVPGVARRGRWPSIPSTIVRDRRTKPRRARPVAVAAHGARASWSTTINHGRPAAIGIDILMPEPIRFRPSGRLRRWPRESPALAQDLAALPRNDAALARSLAAAPTVLAVAGSAR